MAATLKLDGHEYALPTFQDLTIGEAAAIEKHAEMTVAQIEQLEDDVPIGALIGLAIVGIRRHRPDVSERDARKAVEGIKLTEMREAFDVGQGKADEDPESARGEQAESDESLQASGETSSSDSEPSNSQDSGPQDSGHPSSVTPAPSIRAIS